MNDATCPKCYKRFGWSGRMIDKPPCPRCGYKDDPAELRKADEEIARIIKEMFNEKG